MPWSDLTLAAPWWLVLLAVPPLLYYALRRTGRTLPALPLPTLEAAGPLPPTWRTRALRYLPVLWTVAWVLLSLALCRPQRVLTEEEIKTEGIDIVLVLDLSNSMLAQDFQPNRLEVAKRVAADFVRNRPYDRIGLSLFGEVAYTKTPPTTDHRVVVQDIENLRIGELPERGTAIGMGLMAAINRLVDSEATSRVVILLTDGVNNRGYVDPELAAETASKLGVTVYTVAVGSTGTALTPSGRRSDGTYIYQMQRVVIDEVTLQNIARKTGGQYFRATNAEALEQIYAQIDAMEKTEIEVTTLRRETELFRWFLLPGLALFLLGWGLREVLVRV